MFYGSCYVYIIFLNPKHDKEKESKEKLILTKDFFPHGIAEKYISAGVRNECFHDSNRKMDVFFFIFFLSVFFFYKKFWMVFF